MRWHLRRGILSRQFCGEWCSVVWYNVSEKESLHPDEGSSKTIRTVDVYEQTEWCNIHDENISLISSQHRGTRPESKLAFFTWFLSYTPTKTKCITSHTLLAYSLVQTCNLFVTWILKYSRHDMPLVQSVFVHCREDDIHVMTEIPSRNKYKVPRTNYLTLWPTTTF